MSTLLLSWYPSTRFAVIIENQKSCDKHTQTDALDALRTTCRRNFLVSAKNVLVVKRQHVKELCLMIMG